MRVISRSLAGAIVSGAAVLVVSVVFFCLPASALDLVLKWGVFWILLLLVFIWTLGLYKVFRRGFLPVRGFVALEKWPLLLVLLCSLYIQLHEPRGLKVYPDEAEIASVARSLHMSRTNAVIEVGHTLGDVHHVASSVTWSGDYLFPFMVGMVHGLTGFRLENTHYLNAVLGFVSLLLFYAFCRSVMNRLFSCFAVLCICGVPLFHEVATSGGPELLFMSLVFGVLVLVSRVLKTSDPEDCGLLLLTWALLVCSSAYGWLWTLVPVTLTVMRPSIWRGRLSRLWWQVWIMPLLLPSFHVLLAKLKFISDDRSVGFADFMFLRFGETISYLYDFSRSFSNGPVLGVLGSIALVFMILILMRPKSGYCVETRGRTVLISLFMVIVFLSLIASWTSSDKGWMHPSGSRSALSLYFLMALAVPYVLSSHSATCKMSVWFLFAPLVVAFHANGTWGDWGAPYRIKDTMTLGRHYLERKTKQDFKSRGTLYLGDGAIEMNASGWAAMPIRVANKMPERIERLVEIGIYEHVVVGQFLGDRRGLDKDMISQRFVLEPLYMKILADGIGVELSRIVGIRSPVPGDETEPTNLPLPRPPIGASRDMSRKYVEDLFFYIPE